MTFGKCQCCAVLKEEIAFLRSLVRPAAPMRFNPLPSVTLEADAIISGADTQLELSPEEQKRQELIDAEATRILSGTY